MKRVLVAALLALVAAPAPAHAQPAEALGKPLMAADLPVGTVTVRVIVGDQSAVAPGYDVTLVVNGAPRTARTDAEGRATFSGLPAGATVQATIAGADGAEVSSDQFAIPGGSGARLMLSTKPPAAGAAPAGAGGPQMPQPRQITGVAREEPADPPGMLTVLVTYADILGTSGSQPAGHQVYLVGYTVDDRVIVLRDDTDPSGRAEFTGLDVSGDTVYYAMTLLPRAGGFDRLISPAVQPMPGVGLRMVLSGETRTSAGQRSEARSIALSVGWSHHSDGRFALAAMGYHDALRLGAPADAVAGPLAEVAVEVDGPVVAAMAEHADALQRRDRHAVEKAARAFEHAGMILHAAEAMAGASVLAVEAGLRASASDLRVQASSLAARCGPALTPLLEPISDRDALGSLTRKEQEVALMAARGMTKREIADSLCVSVRTVGNHINHLYGKLGVATRDELRAMLDMHDRTVTAPSGERR